MSILELESILTGHGAITRVEVNAKGTHVEGTRFDPGPHESWEWSCNDCEEICTNLTLNEALAQEMEHVCPEREEA